MTTEYAVKAETHEGNVLMLRRGFLSVADAEDHPIQLSLWKRVWIEAIGPAPSPDAPPPSLPPLPWDVTVAALPSNNGKRHIYLVDATGRKIAAIWGREGEKELTAEHILKAVTAYGAEK